MINYFHYIIIFYYNIWNMNTRLIKFTWFIIKVWKKINIPLLLILALAVFTRFYDLTWDSYRFYNPDELKVTHMINSIKFFSQMQPNSFTYNGFYIYLVRAVVEVKAWLLGDPASMGEYDNLLFLSRTVTAILSILTVAEFYLFCKSFLKKQTALIVTFIFTINIGLIQQAHFGTTDTALLFFLMSLLLVSSRIFREPKKVRLWILAGVLYGLAIGTKTTGTMFGLILGITWLVLTVRDRKWGYIFLFLLTLLLAAAVAYCTTPYSFLNWSEYMGAMNFEKGVLDLSIDVPWNMQFVDRPYYKFLADAAFILTPFVGICGILGLAVWTVKMIKSRDAGMGWVLIAWFLAYFIFITYTPVRFIRYLLPLVFPVIAGMGIAIDWVNDIFNRNTLFKRIFLFFTLIIPLLIFVFFLNVYKGDTREEASRWMANNTSGKITVLVESYDYGLPIQLDSRNTNEFVTYDAFIPDSSEKFTVLALKMQKADYIILSSRRFSGTIPPLAKRFPHMSKFYTKLDNGYLGFDKVGEFRSGPGLFGYTINDDVFEETFQTFDHPPVRIYRNNKLLNKDQIYSKLMD
jgi:hypothetical protein